MLSDQIETILMTDGLRNSMKEYFEGMEIGLNDPVYPPVVRGLQGYIPDLENKIEIIPFIQDINPTTGFVRIGWNMFVLGIHRMFLGYSGHESLQHLERQMSDNPEDAAALRKTTPIEIISFITNKLEQDQEHIPVGTVKSMAPKASSSKMPVGSIYYERNKLNVGRL